MKKNYVLDTNVILNDPKCIFSFEDNNVYIPITVVEELDKFKKENNELGRNARKFARTIDGLINVSNSVSNGLKLNSDEGLLYIVVIDNGLLNKLPIEIRENKPDNKILAVAYEIHKKNKTIPTIFVSKDINLRIKSASIGVPAEDYEHDKVVSDELYTGTTEVIVPSDMIDRFYKDKGLTSEIFFQFNPNTYITLISETNQQHTALCKYNGKNRKIIPLKTVPREGIWGINPKNREQHFAMDALLDDDIKLVTMSGKAGTGKTLVALACGLVKVWDEGLYNKLLVSRPIMPMGKDIGFLPGNIEEKLNPWMQPVFDNLDFLLSGYNKNEVVSTGKTKKNVITNEKNSGKLSKGYKELFELGVLQIEPLTFIRGRSIPYQYMLTDECQNCSAHEIKTILTRIGECSKIILSGDPQQIDNPYLDSSSNGLSYVVEKMKGENISAHVTFIKGERSELAEIAANLL